MKITYGAITPLTNPSSGKIRIGLYQMKFILQMRQIMSWSYKYHIKSVHIVIKQNNNRKSEIRLANYLKRKNSGELNSFRYNK